MQSSKQIAGGGKNGVFQTLRGFACVSVLMLGGCALGQTHALPPSAPVQMTMPPLSAASLGQSRSAQQIVRAAFGDQEATLQCVVDVTPQRLSVIAVNALGLRLFSVSVIDGVMTVERAPGVPEQVQPEQILRDIQLAYWPLAALQSAWAADGWNVSAPFAGTRRLKRNGRLIAEVHYAQPAQDAWRGRLWLSNYALGYSLAVDSQPMDAD